METYYHKRNQLKKDYLTDLNLHTPEWAKRLVELYTSPLKYSIKYEGSKYQSDY